jgi:TolB-like protein/Tfp pilus assembly protein PilF
MTESGDPECPREVAAAAAVAASVFISYASPDRALADAVVEALERRGIPCWIAPRDVVAGEFYADAIVRALDVTRTLVVVLSARAAASPHVMREVERASSKRHTVISLRLDRTPLPAGLQYFLNTSQWLDASEGELQDSTVSTLVEAVRRSLVAPSASGATSSITATSSHGIGLGAKPRSRAVALAAALAGLALLVGSGTVWWSRQATVDRQIHGVAAASDSSAAASAASTPPAHSIAVLPFVNMSGDPTQDYFSDGISEELLDSLSRFRDLQVAARTSSFSFKGQNVDIATIARKLNVGTVLEGSVRRAGDRVRITAELINAATGFHLWSQTYDRQWSDILRVQTEVASAVAKQLEVRILGNEEAQIELGGTKSAQAYDAFLRGQQLSYGADLHETAYRAALAAFDQAIALDPQYALAYARRASALLRIYDVGNDPATRAALNEQARAAAEHAVALAPQLGEAHLALAITLEFGMRDYATMNREYRLALALAPGSAWVQSTFGVFARQMGNSDEALRAARRAVRLDPENLQSYIRLADALVGAREFPEALATLRAAQRLKANSHWIGGSIVYAVLSSGENQQARQLCESASTPLDDDDRHSCLALALHALGETEAAKRELEAFRALDGDSAAFSYAAIYSQWGDKTAALKWLAKAEDLKDPGMLDVLVSWMLDPIRDEPEFKALLKKMNLPL